MLLLKANLAPVVEERHPDVQVVARAQKYVLEDGSDRYGGVLDLFVLVQVAKQWVTDRDVVVVTLVFVTGYSR